MTKNKYNVKSQYFYTHSRMHGLLGQPPAGRCCGSYAPNDDPPRTIVSQADEAASSTPTAASCRAYVGSGCQWQKAARRGAGGLAHAGGYAGHPSNCRGAASEHRIAQPQTYVLMQGLIHRRLCQRVCCTGARRHSRQKKL